MPIEASFCYGQHSAAWQMLLNRVRLHIMINSTSSPSSRILQFVCVGASKTPITQKVQLQPLLPLSRLWLLLLTPTSCWPLIHLTMRCTVCHQVALPICLLSLVRCVCPSLALTHVLLSQSMVCAAQYALAKRSCTMRILSWANKLHVFHNSIAQGRTQIGDFMGQASAS